MVRLSPLGILVLIAALIAAPARADDDADAATVGFEIMKLDIALRLASATLADCRRRGFQVAVSVVDRFGNPQVLLRDRFAGMHTPETARRKAWTAASFRTDTLDLATATQPGRPESGIRAIGNVVAVGGGVPVLAAGSLVGAVGVSGAPGGEQDDACARAGIAEIEDDLAF